VNLLPQFDRIFIDLTSKDSEVAARVQELYPASTISFIDEANPSQIVLNTLHKKGGMTAEEFNDSKKTLLLTTFKGQLPRFKFR
jgi:hypothetical protein